MIHRFTLYVTSLKPGIVCRALFAALIMSVYVGYSDLANAELIPVPQVIRSSHDFPNIEAASWILADYHTGWILGGENIDDRVEPASLTKLMTSYLIFDALKAGRLSEEDMVFVSNRAYRAVGSRMYIEENTKVSVIDLLNGLVIQSGNDAAIALAEHYGGSEESFAMIMNQKAAELGMTNTRFTNSSGLPDPGHYSTLRDITMLSISLIRNFPNYFKLHSELEFTYNNITQQNRNILLTRDSRVDGLKTGYTQKAGYCLIATANQEGFRLIAGVLGAKSRLNRADQVHELIRYGYYAYDSIDVLKKNTHVVAVPMLMGEENDVSVGTDKGIRLLYPKETRQKLSASFELPEEVEAPLSDGQQVGFIQIKYDKQPVMRSSLHVIGDYPEGPWYKKIYDLTKRMIFRWFDAPDSSTQTE
ncbi:MAG: D-alanyl-D-alanine carboxypeptidase [Gammaproteobacteria bacterium]|nr:D-alanyl-D-alanine carboxypeptidase [Gammaproteobacteria bacterium]